MKKLATGVILGGVVIGATASVISNMDKKTVKKMKRTGQKFVNKATNTVEDLFDNIR